MKKHIMSLVTLVLFVVFLGATSTTVRAEQVTCGEGLKTVVFHWHRHNGDYDNLGLHVWDTGAGGTSDSVSVESVGIDGFGAYFNICIGENPAEKIGVIPLKLNEDGSKNWDTKASYNQDNLYVDISYLFTEIEPEEGDPYTPDVLHVFFVDNGAEVYQIDNYNEKLNYIFVLYADESNRYEGWQIHTWDTDDGDSTAWGSYGLPLGGTSYTTTHDFPMKLTAIGVGDNATKVGFIVTNWTTKAYDQDIFITGDDLAGISEEGQDFVFLHYLSGQAGFSTKDDFFAAANEYRIEFKFKPFINNPQGDETKGTYAQSPNLIQVEFNQQVRVKVKNDDTGMLEDYEGFSTDFFTLTEDGKEIDIVVSYLEEEEFVTNFVITFPDENFKLDNTKEYKLFYDNGIEDEKEQQKAEIVVDLDTQKPTIRLIDEKDAHIKIPFGAKFNEGKFKFPDFIAQDDRDGNITDRVFVPDTKGIVDTGKAGKYEVTIAVRDSWGNYNELTFIYEVLEPKTGLSTGAWVGIISGLVVIVGAVVGTVIFTRKKSQ